MKQQKNNTTKTNRRHYLVGRAQKMGKWGSRSHEIENGGGQQECRRGVFNSCRYGLKDGPSLLEEIVRSKATKGTFTFALVAALVNGLCMEKSVVRETSAANARRTRKSHRDSEQMQCRMPQRDPIPR